jgi:23S rRNA (adenine2503-C2)-methyltransferase
MPGLYDMSRAQIADLLDGEPPYRAEQLWAGLYERAADPGEMTNLPGVLRQRLSELPPSLTESSRWVSDHGLTVKWLFSLEDGSSVETVLMHYGRRATVCVSTQAGCAMGCTFCATGQGGFARHLSVGEIVEQVVVARREASPRRVSNVVFMGMGEPLANYDRVLESAKRFNTDMGISARRLTISTVGLVPGIRKLSHEPLPLNLAVSLHAANDELRNTLVPMNRTYPIGALLEACGQYVSATSRRLSFEWALIAGVNDDRRDAEELSVLARRLAAHVNLIPLNPTPGFPARGSSAATVGEFRETLEALGVNVTVRATRGSDIDAACGQLSGVRSASSARSRVAVTHHGARCDSA